MKCFYVMASSDIEALECDAVEEESHPNFTGDVDWEHFETEAVEQSEEETKFIRARHPELIL